MKNQPHNDPESRIKTSQQAVQMGFVADALAMPVHWYYRRSDIDKAFPEGIQQMHPAPARHPYSIMSLHSKQQGGRSAVQRQKSTEVVGELILKDKGHLWDQPNVHYHHGMQAGENTLNAHTVLWLMESIKAADHQYQDSVFLQHYIQQMTADSPTHPDTYAESYHRGFFANLAQGKAPQDAAAVTHDTASVGGLIRIGPLVLWLISRGFSVAECKSVAARHLRLTHPDQKLTQVCFQFVDLIEALLSAEGLEQRKAVLRQHLMLVDGRFFKHNDISQLTDHQMVGGHYSTACYITDSWPSLLFLANKYADDTRQALIANTELGGDNVHRGAVLALILTLANHQFTTDWFEQLQLHAEIKALTESLFCLKNS